MSSLRLLHLGLFTSLLVLQASGSEPAKQAAWPEVPRGVTSFGGAIAGDYLYIYGGHTGGAHRYWKSAQDNFLQRIRISQPKAWEKVAEGPHLQGLALVSLQGKLFRVGGFTARNAEGEEHDLHSTNSFAQFDPNKIKKKDVSNKKEKIRVSWDTLPPLPEPRSSHDAVVLGDYIYVAGGWQLRGDEPTQWHKTAYRFKASDPKAKWERLPDPPFHRRALALGTLNGEVYVIGGMQKEGGATTQVAVYDPAKKQWRKGPAIPGKGMEGFGPSAFEVNGSLFVSTYSGKLWRLDKNAKKWELEKKLSDARFFHRMLPLGAKQLISIGGASMETGKFLEPEIVKIHSQ